MLREENVAKDVFCYSFKHKVAGMKCRKNLKINMSQEFKVAS